MGAIEEYRARRAKRLAERFGTTRLDKKDNVAEYKRRRAARLEARGYRADAPYQEPTDQEIQQLQKSRGGGGSKGGGGHGNTRLPFGLCKRFGIDIDPSWTPRDAWDALAGKGITPDGAYGRLKRGEDPGTPDKREEKTPEVTKKPVNSIKIGEYPDAEYKHLKASKRTWGVRKGDDKWMLAGDLVEGSGSGGYAPKMMRRTFKTKTDIFAFLKEHGVEEFEDPETGEVVNPKEMEIPEPALKVKTHISTAGYTALTLGLRGGRYVLTGTDYDGGKVKLGDWSTIGKAKDYVQRFGGKVEDMKMSPALKKREAERVAWLKSDKKEYFEKDGVKYGDVEISGGGYYGWTISGESEDGQKTTVRAKTKAEAMQYLKEQGVQKVRINKKTFNPQDFEIPKTIAEIDGTKYQKLKFGFQDYSWGHRVAIIGTDLDGHQQYIITQEYEESYADFENRIKKYGISKDQIEISDEYKAKMEQVEKEEAEKERRKAEFAAKAEWFGGRGYSDVEIEKGPWGLEMYGYTWRGVRQRMESFANWPELKQYLAGYRKGDADIERYIKDDAVRETYEKYKEGIKEFEAKAKEFGGRKYANVKISAISGSRFGTYLVSGVDERGREQRIAQVASFADLEDVFKKEGLSFEDFPIDDEARKKVEEAKKVKEAIATGKYYSFGKADRAYNNVRVEQDDVGWTIYATGMDGKERRIEALESWNEAVTKLAEYGVSDYKVKDKSGTEMGMPSMGMRSVMLMKKPDGGFTVYADTPSDTHKVMHEAKTEQEARKWLRENNVPDSDVKTKGMNPNDTVVRSVVPKTLAKFDEHRMKAIEGTYLDDMSDADKQDLADMLKTAFTQGDYRAARSTNSFLGILESGYKSQIEIGHGGTGAAQDIASRKKCSDAMFGHGGLDKTEYETMGYLAPSDIVEDYDSGDHPWYGDPSALTYTFKKDTLKDRVTYTFGDSLNTWHHGTLTSAGYAGENPTIEGMTGCREVVAKKVLAAYRKYKRGEIDFSQMMGEIRNNANNNYIELQFTGGVTIKDIEKVSFNSVREIRNAFGRMGVEGRKKAIKLLKENNIGLEYRANFGDKKFSDGYDWLKKNYPSEFSE